MSDLRNRERELMRRPVLGVVVIGRNEGDRLLSCLDSAAGSGCSIVYVDSGSRDDSVEQARARGAAVVRLDEAQPFTAARARNAGFVALARLEPALSYVQFVDGDCDLAPGWLALATAFLESRPDLAAVCGRRRERYPERSVFNRLCDMEWDTPVGAALECGGDVLLRARAFWEVGGYSDGLIAGEEPELCVRLRSSGWVVWRLDAEMTRHDAAMTRFRQWWRRCSRGGYAFAEVSRLHRGTPCAIWQSAVRRAVLWGGLIPAAAVLGTALHPAALGLWLLYPVQIARIARRRGVRSRAAWTYAAFALLGKLPELQGSAAFYADCWRGRSGRLIEYKQA